MSQFPHAPVPGAYVPPSSAQPLQYPPQQQEGQYYQQPPNPSPFQSSGGNAYAPQHNASPAQGSSKFSAASMGQMFNQAVSTSKPAWQKLSKTVGQKLNKPSSTSYGNPAHQDTYNAQQYQNNSQNAQQYQTYQQHPQQTNTQYQAAPQGQPQTNPQQYQTAQQGQPTDWQSNTYANNQQPSLPSSNNAPPTQNNYFPPQQIPSPAQIPQQAQPFSQPQQAYNQYGGQEQSQGMVNPQGQYQQETGITGTPGIQHGHNVSPVSPEPPNITPFPPNINSQGQAWAGNGQANLHQNVQNIASPGTPQHSAPFSPTPPPQGFPTPPMPSNVAGQPAQWMPGQTPAPMSPGNQHQPAPINAPPFMPAQASPPPMPQSGAPPEMPQSHMESKPVSPQPTSSAPPPTEFLAELPADSGYVGSVTSSTNASSKQAETSPQQYQAYHQNAQAVQAPSRPQSFTVPRRAVSASGASISTAPWRIADPSTEQPTAEFFVLADLLFDGLDKNCEPKSTGFLEASKILESWKVQGIADEPAQLFMYNHFHAFASLWTLEGVPHLMVPNEPRLTPSQAAQPDPQTLKILPELPVPTSTYPNYVPALNRVGWYKYLFLEMVGEPEGLEKMLPAFCAETYNPAVSGHPDLSRRDKSEPQSLSARANSLRTGAIARVCQEAATAMGFSNVGGQAQPNQQGNGVTEAEVAAKMQSLKIQNQMNDMLNQSMIAGGQSFSTAAGNTYVPRFG